MQVSLLLRPDGSVVLPDLTDDLAALAGALDVAPVALPCELGPARLRRAHAITVEADDESALWAAHAAGAERYRHGQTGGAGVPWLSVKQRLAESLLGPACQLCARGCAVDRRRGERGLCGLGADWRTMPPARLWGEEPELGAPGLAWASYGCGLRCRFCYRPDNLRVPAASAPPAAPTATAVHQHFLGGNPDESLPGILAYLAAQEDPLPVVWNTHSYLTLAQAALLEGVVDAFVADLKFGPGPCGAELAGVPGYWPAATAALALLARSDAHLLVRHVALPGHLECCARPVARWVRAHLPLARLVLLDQYEPYHEARRLPGLNRRLNDVERAALAALGAETP